MTAVRCIILHSYHHLLALVADAAATMYMLPIVCAPFLEPLMRFLANTFPDAAMRTVLCCSDVLFPQNTMV